MIRSIIIDDVEKARIALKSDLDDFCPSVQVVAEADGVESGVAMINEHKPDMIFLDIKMGDGSGFDLLEKLKEQGEIGFNVIFTTAYDQYAIKAFKYSALDYLLKPIDPEDLQAAIAKYEEKPEPAGNEQISFLLQQLSQQNNSLPKKLALSSTDKIQMVDIKDIVRCEASGNYTIFVLTDGQQIVVSKTMKEYAELLEQQGFARPHHSHMVNLEQVKEFVKIDGTYLVMKNGNEVPVSVRKREDLVSRLQQL